MQFTLDEVNFATHSPTYKVTFDQVYYQKSNQTSSYKSNPWSGQDKVNMIKR